MLSPLRLRSRSRAALLPLFRGGENFWPVTLKNMTSIAGSTQPTTPRGPYQTAKLSPEHKEFMARLSQVLERRHGLSKTEVRAAYAEAGTSVPERTMRRLMSEVDSPAVHPTSVAKRGRPARLDDEQKHVLFGHVLEKILKHESVTRDTVQTFVKATFGVVVQLSWCSSVLAEGGFAYRIVNNRNPGKMLTDLELADIYLGDVDRLRNAGWWRDEFWVIDFTYNTSRRHVLRSYGVQGAAQPIVADTSGHYTDCYVMLVSNKGKRMGPIMFTYDPAFGTDTPKSKEGRQHRAAFKAAMVEHGIPPAHVVCMATEATASKQYLAESAAVVEYLIHQFNIKKLKILRDDGGAHKRGAKDLWVDAGCEVIVMAPETHADLSPLDNMLWAYAKKAAAQNPAPRKEHARYALRLLREIMDVPDSEIAYWFNKNFMVGIGNPDRPKALAAMRGDHHRLYSFHRACLHKYYVHVGTETGTCPASDYSLESALDGVYWYLQ